jgi:hypothetical protein
MLKIIGYVLLALSFLMWGLIFIIPWFDLSKSRMVGITAILIIAGEAFFYLSIIILGKQLFDKFKKKFKFWKPGPEQDNRQIMKK